MKIVILKRPDEKFEVSIFEDWEDKHPYFTKTVNKTGLVKIIKNPPAER